MFTEERHQKIIQLLNLHQRVVVNDLVNDFQVTGATIRSDLASLAAKGLLKRTRGGAVLAKDIYRDEDQIIDRHLKNQDVKDAIAAQALSYINEGDAVFLDSGTTILQLARHMANCKNITVITNDLQIALELDKNPDIELIILGGKIRNNFQCIVGNMGLDALQKININKLFISANALSISGGATTPNILQAEMKSRLMALAQTKYLLCDSSKFGQVTACKYAAINEFDLIITDDKIEHSYLSELRKNKANVVLC